MQIIEGDSRVRPHVYSLVVESERHLDGTWKGEVPKDVGDQIVWQGRYWKVRLREGDRLYLSKL